MEKAVGSIPAQTKTNFFLSFLAFLTNDGKSRDVVVFLSKEIISAWYFCTSLKLIESDLKRAATR